jgi:hypothetical protein
MPDERRGAMGLTGQANLSLSVLMDHRGKPFLMIRPSGRGKDLLQDGFISLSLREDMIFDEAQALAEDMRKHVVAATIQTEG